MNMLVCLLASSLSHVVGVVVQDVCVVIFAQVMFGLLLAFALKGFGRVPSNPAPVRQMPERSKRDPE